MLNGDNIYTYNTDFYMITWIHAYVKECKTFSDHSIYFIIIRYYSSPALPCSCSNDSLVFLFLLKNYKW